MVLHPFDQIRTRRPSPIRWRPVTTMISGGPIRLTPIDHEATVRCDTPVRNSTDRCIGSFRLRGRSALGITRHSKTVQSPSNTVAFQSGRRINVTGLGDHKFKLLQQGSTTPVFELLALFSELRGMRAFCSEVGRIVRNPGRARGGTSHIRSLVSQPSDSLMERFSRIRSAYSNREKKHPAALALNQARFGLCASECGSRSRLC